MAYSIYGDYLGCLAFVGFALLTVYFFLGAIGYSGEVKTWMILKIGVQCEFLCTYFFWPCWHLHYYLEIIRLRKKVDFSLVWKVSLSVVKLLHRSMVVAILALTLHFGYWISLGIKKRMLCNRTLFSISSDLRVMGSHNLLCSFVLVTVLVFQSIYSDAVPS
uniref:Uncharacterized protein n=1 Tax=Solanum lycopersicum TaxID=4081 RepID=K4CCR9_SOLLC